MREDAHRYREFNCAQILATLRSMAINVLRLGGFWSITEGIAASLTTSKACLGYSGAVRCTAAWLWLLIPQAMALQKPGLISAIHLSPLALRRQWPDLMVIG